MNSTLTSSPISTVGTVRGGFETTSSTVGEVEGNYEFPRTDFFPKSIIINSVCSKIP